jgi:hypothetical protein
MARTIDLTLATDDGVVTFVSLESGDEQANAMRSIF